MTPEQKLQTAFREVLCMSPGTSFEKLAYRDTQEWDSVAHMQIVNAIETHFTIMLETEDVIAMSSYPRAKELLGKYGVTF